MDNKTGGILAIGAGIGFIYLAYTGYLQSFWTGLKGGYAGKSAGDTPPAGSNGNATSPTSSTTKQSGGAAQSRSLGRGRDLYKTGQGGEAVYYTGPSGAMMASDAGSFW